MLDHACRWITLSFLLSLLSPPARAQISQCGDGSTPQLVFTPTRLIINRNSQRVRAVVTCRYAQVVGLVRKRLILNRTADTSATSTTLVTADEDGVSNLKAVASSNVTGSFDSSVNFTMSAAYCPDTKQTYSCETTSTLESSPTTKVFCLQTGRLAAVSEPSDVRLDTSPNTDTFSVGDTLTLTCSGTVGLKGEGGSSEWVWEEKEDDSTWIPLKKSVYLGQIETLSSCLQVRYAVLKVNLRGSHNGRTYRCYLVKNGRAFTEAAVSRRVTVDSFVFGLKTLHGAVVLAGVVIILFAFLAAIAVGVRHYMRYQVNLERNMYRERVMNRLDKLFRFEAELIGGVMKKRKSAMPEEPAPVPEEPPPPPPPKPKKRLKEEDVDPTEITIQLQMPQQEKEQEEPEPEPEPEPEEEEEEESDIFDPTGPIDKV